MKKEWKELSEQIKEYSIRNKTLVAIRPIEAYPEPLKNETARCESFFKGSFVNTYKDLPPWVKELQDEYFKNRERILKEMAEEKMKMFYGRIMKK